MPTQTPPTVHHHFRTFFAAIFGILAFCLILASILVLWLNRTILDTSTYVRTVAPIVTQVDVQNFVVDKATEQLLTSGPTRDMATELLPASEVEGKTDQQLQEALKPIIQSSVLQVVNSQQFVELWKTTNQTAHANFLAQLQEGGNEINLDLSPAVAGVIAQLKETELRSISEKIVEEPLEAKINLKGSTLDQIYDYYRLFTQLSLVLIAVTFLAIFLSIGISVHHIKTLRRIIFGTGILALILTIVLQVPKLIGPTLDGLEPKAAAAVASVLVHNLQIATLILAIVCLLISIGSKFHPKLKSGITK